MFRYLQNATCQLIGLWSEKNSGPSKVLRTDIYIHMHRLSMCITKQPWLQPFGHGLLDVCMLFSILLLGLQFLVSAGHTCTWWEKPIKDAEWTAVLWKQTVKSEELTCRIAVLVELKTRLINTFWVTRTGLLTCIFPRRKTHRRCSNFFCTLQIERGHSNSHVNTAYLGLRYYIRLH